MFKIKSHLRKIVRKHNENDKSQYNFRLDQSERISEFNSDFFNDFIKTLKQTDFITYPYLDNLKSKIAIYNNVKKNNIFLIPGSDVGIKSMFELCVTPGSEVVSTFPSFPMYKVYCDLYKGIFNSVPYEENLTYSLEKLKSLITKKTSLVIIANPNNPIGDYKTKEELEEFIKLTNKLGIPVLIDEAYVEFSPGTLKEFSFRYNNVCISRTFSKAWGGAGIRLGYIIGNTRIITYLSKFRLMHEVTGIAAKYGCYLLDNKQEMENYVTLVNKEKTILSNLFTKSKFDIVESNTNWIHFNDKTNNKTTDEIWSKRKDIIYKGKTTIPFDNRNNWIRLTVGPNLHQQDFIQQILG